MPRCGAGLAQCPTTREIPAEFGQNARFGAPTLVRREAFGPGEKTRRLLDLIRAIG
jgi:hypothetical protein